MSRKEQIQKIIDRLVDGTLNGSVVWKQSPSIFNSETSHKYQTSTEDGKTLFDIEIKLDSKFKPHNNYLYLYMHNSELIDGRMQIASTNYTGLDKLQQLIYNKWIVTTLPQKNEDFVLNNILNNIGDKQTRRDQILDELLHPHNIAAENTTDKTEKKEGFFKRLFK